MSGITKKYITLGLRREKNLSDTAVPETALNGLLDNLVNDPSGNFLSEDLNAIRGIQNTNINSSKLSELAGITVTVSELNDENVVVERVVSPLITLNDRLENAKIVTGNIPAIQGGDGLLARFIPSSDVNPGSKLSTGDTIFNIRPDQLTEVLWENGYFNFPSFIEESFNDQYGGIQWTGFFTPTLRDPSINIAVVTSGLFIFEIDPTESDSWQTVSSLYSETRVLTTISGNGTVGQATLADGEIKYAAVGDIVDVENNITVTAVNLLTSVITFSENVLVANNEITVRKVSGETVTRSVISLFPIEVGKQIKIRLSFWFPDNNENVIEKLLEVDYVGSQLRYTNLYSVKPDELPEEFEIRQFLLDAVSPYQDKIGTPGNDRKVYFNNSLLLNYSPEKNNIGSIRKQGPVTVTFSNTTNIITGTLASSEIGNIIVPVNPVSPINTIVRIKDFIGANVKVIDTNIGVSESISVNIVDHRGFINWYRATSSGLTVTLITGNTADLVKGFLVISTTSNTYIKITNIVSLTQFTTNINLALTGTEVIFVYSDKSLVDRSKEVFCNGVFGRVVGVTANAGATSLTLESVSGITSGQYIQFDGIIPTSTQVVGAPVGNVITISNPLSAALSASNTVIFVPEVLGGDISREGCVVPLNTAPPFEGTAIGLSTNGKGIKADSELPSLSVTANVISADILSNNVTATVDTQFDRTVSIKAKLGVNTQLFSILGKSN